MMKHYIMKAFYNVHQMLLCFNDFKYDEINASDDINKKKISDLFSQFSSTRMANIIINGSSSRKCKNF